MSDRHQVVKIQSGKYLRLKVCGMREPENIRELVKLPIDYMGLIFYPHSPRYLPDDGAAVQLIRHLSVRKVGVFVDEEMDEVLKKWDQYKLDFVQLHGSESLFYCQQLKKKGLKIIKAFAVDENFHFSNTEAYEFDCRYFLFDTKGARPGGTGKQFDWSLLENYTGKLPFLLSGGIRPETIGNILALRHPRLHGIDVNSGFEDAPGVKNIGMIKKVIQDIDNKEFTPDDYNNMS